MCTYYGSQQTCGGEQTAGGTLIRRFDDKATKKITRVLDGKSINSQRAETLETNTGFIRGSFVSYKSFIFKLNYMIFTYHLSTFYISKKCHFLMMF